MIWFFFSWKKRKSIACSTQGSAWALALHCSFTTTRITTLLIMQLCFGMFFLSKKFSLPSLNLSQIPKNKWMNWLHFSWYFRTGSFIWLLPERFLTLANICLKARCENASACLKARKYNNKIKIKQMNCMETCAHVLCCWPFLAEVLPVGKLALRSYVKPGVKVLNKAAAP